MTACPDPAAARSAPPGPWSFPTADAQRLANGIDVVVYQLPGQQVIAAHLVLDVPLTAEDRATSKAWRRSAPAPSTRAPTSTPARSSPSCWRPRAPASGSTCRCPGCRPCSTCPSAAWTARCELFAEAVIEPALAADDVDRHVQLRLAEIEQARANSAQLASIAFRRAVFAAESRASRMNGGEPETVGAVTPPTVRAFHRDRRTGRRPVILAGDFAGIDPVALAERTFGGGATSIQRRRSARAVRPGPRRR